MSRASDLWDRILAGGPEAVRSLVEERQTEQYFLDFKRSTNQGSTPRLADRDRNNLARAISGFGNSEGGLLIWGIDCSEAPDGADAPHSEHLLENATRFASLLTAAVTGCTVPPHTLVENHPVLVDGERGFVVTHVPKSSLLPHQLIPDGRYFIRAGSSFLPTPHDVLAGMFGRAPRPRVFGQFTLHPPRNEGDALIIRLGLLVRNEGPTIARDLYLVATGLRIGGQRSSLRFHVLDPEVWRGEMAFGVRLGLITAAGFRLPPTVTSTAAIATLELRPPFEEPFRMALRIGASDAPPWTTTIEASPAALQELHIASREATDDALSRLVSQVIPGDPHGASQLP